VIDGDAFAADKLVKEVRLALNPNVAVAGVFLDEAGRPVGVPRDAAH
jgi:hypothetical protein